MFRTVGLYHEKSKSVFEWKVRYSAGEPRDGLYESPRFETCGIIWTLSIQTNSWEDKMYLFLNSCSYSDGVESLFYKLSIKKTDGMEYLSEEEICRLTRSARCSKSITFVESDLLRNDVAPDGVLTFSCAIIYDSTNSTVMFRTVGIFHEKSKSAFEWKVRYTRSTRTDGLYKSPKFESCGKTWNLAIRKVNPNTMSFYLESLCDKREHLEYKLSIKKTDGTDYLSEEHSYTLLKCGMANSKCIIMREKDLSRSDVAPDDVLTFSCTITNPSCITGGTNMSSKCKDECTQTEISYAPSQEDKSELPNSDLDKLQQDLKNMLISGEDSDVVVRVKDQEFKAHRSILSARSAVFRTMFRHDMAEGNSGIVDITDCDPVAFQDFLCFLYSGRVGEFFADKVFDLYNIADKYDIKDLKIKCLTFMVNNISVDTFCEILTLALQHNELELIQKANCFFVRNGMEIIRTADWLTFMNTHSVEANELYMKALKSREE